MNLVNTLIDMVASQYGLVPKSDWPKRIYQHIGTLCERREISSGNLESQISWDRSILREIAGSLTIEETYFFRHPHHFETLLKFLEPRLKETDSSQGISIWSAGCASGSEPYSLALALKRKFNAEDQKRISIFACDLNLKAIQRAKSGLFHEWSFRETEPSIVALYFQKVTSRDYQIRQDIRSMVHFEHLSIQEQLEKFGPNSLDAIFFRNVGVYMDSSSISKIYNRFAAALKKEGLLLVSATDPRPQKEFFFTMTSNDTTVYRLLDPLSKEKVEISGYKAPILNRQNNRRQKKKTPFRPEPSRDKSCLSLPKDSHCTVSWVRQLADKGKHCEAMDLCHQILGSDRKNSAVYRLRGELFLHDRQSSKALEDFERAVSMEPEDLLMRFWYALGLEAAGQFVIALGEVRRLIDRLASLPGGQILSDGETKVSELLQAATSLERNLE